MNYFLTFEQLNHVCHRLDEGMVLGSALERTGATVFLAHSSRDENLLLGFISVLANHGGRVYINKTGGKLPNLTNHEIAKTLRLTVKECRKCSVSVTTNSKQSNWYPWKLGISDGEKVHIPVSLFPDANRRDEQRWPQQEYLGFYRRIVWFGMKVWAEDGLYVLDHLQNTETPLNEWFTGG